jgi:hypothetical protein
LGDQTGCLLLASGPGTAAAAADACTCIELRRRVPKECRVTGLPVARLPRLLLQALILCLPQELHCLDCSMAAGVACHLREAPLDCSRYSPHEALPSGSQAQRTCNLVIRDIGSGSFAALRCLVVGVVPVHG